MKTILLFMCLLVASMAHAAEYIIAKTTDITTIYVIENAGDNSEYINSYVLTSKPTILELQEIGLPAQLWPVLDQGNQVYDTRLVNSKQEVAELRGSLYESQDANKELASYSTSLTIWITICFIVILILLAVLAFKSY